MFTLCFLYARIMPGKRALLCKHQSYSVGLPCASLGSLSSGTGPSHSMALSPEARKHSPAALPPVSAAAWLLYTGTDTGLSSLRLSTCKRETGAEGEAGSKKSVIIINIH
jgi:hypothetical protein